jgi:hypothetical protein
LPVRTDLQQEIETLDSTLELYDETVERSHCLFGFSRPETLKLIDNTDYFAMENPTQANLLLLLG